MAREQHHEMLAVLEFLCRAAGVSFDITRAEQAVRAMIREYPPTRLKAARNRISEAAAILGVQLLARQFTIEEAVQYVRSQAPLAIYSVTESSTARWFLLAEYSGGKVRLATVLPTDREEWLTADELAERISDGNSETMLDWYFAQAAAPVAEAAISTTSTVPALGHGDGHGHGGGHGHGDGHHGHHAHIPPFRRLIGLLRPERADVGIVLLFAIGVGLFTLAVPIVAMAVVNTVALGTLVQQLFVLCAALFVALGLVAILQTLQSIVVEFIQRRLFVRVANDLAYRLPRVATEAFDRQHGPELVNRFFDVLTVQKAAATLLIDGITIALQILIGMILLGFYHTYLLGFDLILLGCLIFLFTILGWGAVRSAVRESIAKYVVAGWMEEVARHPVAFKTAGGPRFSLERTDTLTREYLIARSIHFRILLRQFAFSLLLQAIANVALLGIGGWLVIKGELTLGELVAAEIVVTLVVATFTKFGKQLEAYYDLLAAVDKLGHLLDLPLERETGERYEPSSNAVGMTLHDVGFTYERSHKPAVDHISFRIEPGERIALVGPNGSGKSTLVDLMFGLRTPHHGYVEIDGIDLRSMKLDTLRETVAVVKGIEAIQGTILDNIRLGRDEVTLSQIQKVLRQVGLYNRIMDLPDGLNTELWTGGAPLSLGQANRLMLARALVSSPKMLILDETLDHMDSDMRETVLPAVMGTRSPWTLIVVTHSDEVVKLCDRVIRLDGNGHITIETQNPVKLEWPRKPLHDHN